MQDMQTWDALPEVATDWQHGVVALGMFDGLHVGHRRVLSRAVALAKSADAKAIAVTFCNHPLSVLDPAREPLYLETPEERRAHMHTLGIDALVTLPFTRALAAQTADAFLERLCASFAPRWVVVGENFTFGAHGGGTTQYLTTHAARFGFEAVICPLAVYGEKPISSTRLRAAIAAASLEEVAAMLGRSFTITGSVMHGDARGRTLGFPTANLAVDARRAMLHSGVYAVRVQTVYGNFYGMANVGANPTFAGTERRLEVHVLDFSGDLYDTPLSVTFDRRLREEIRFPSADALMQQLRLDRAQVREIYGLQAEGNML